MYAYISDVDNNNMSDQSHSIKGLKDYVPFAIFVHCPSYIVYYNLTFNPLAISCAVCLVSAMPG